MHNLEESRHFWSISAPIHEFFLKLNAVNQSSITMETRVEMHHMRYQNKGKGQFYEMISLDLENGLYPSSERS